MFKVVANDNIEYKLISSYELIDLFESKTNKLFTIDEKVIQRHIDLEHRNALILYQQEFYKKNGYYSFPNPIIVSKFKDKYAIIDGQHRYETIKYLNNEKKEIDFKILICVVELNNVEEYDNYFIAINKNKPVQLYNNISVSDWKNIVNQLKIYFIDNYEKYLKDSSNPRKPHINIEMMCDYIDANNIIKKLEISHIGEFIEKIEELNNFYINFGNIKLSKHLKNSDTLINKCINKQKNKPLLLGIFNKFEWIEFIVNKHREKILYQNMEHIPIEKINKRVCIPKKIRQNLWNKYHPNKTLGECYVCQEELSSFNFEAGHVKSVCHGGKNEIENLRPICSICNKDMGVRDLEDFKNVFYKL